MVLWYDRITGQATLRRIKNTHDATAPALGIFHHRDDEDVAFSQLEDSMAVMSSTLHADSNVPTATIPMLAGYVVMAFPQVATIRFRPFELGTFLDEFEAKPAEGEIAGKMEEGLAGARHYVPQGALYAAYLH